MNDMILRIRRKLQGGDKLIISDDSETMLIWLNPRSNCFCITNIANTDRAFVKEVTPEELAQVFQPF